MGKKCIPGNKDDHLFYISAGVAMTVYEYNIHGKSRPTFIVQRRGIFEGLLWPFFCFLFLLVSLKMIV